MAKGKRIVILGDSISAGYTPLVQERMGADPVQIERTGGGDSAQVLENLQEWVIGRHPDVVHFNCGLHDLRTAPETGAHQQELNAYEANLERIVAELKEKTNAALMWATTTPVIEKRHNGGKSFHRFEADVAAYNFRALAIMGEAEIPANDLHGCIMASGPESCIGDDGVHMTEAGNARLADAVVAHLRQVLR